MAGAVAGRGSLRIPLPIGDGPRGRRHPRETPAGASVEGETLAVIVPFAANVRFAAESDEPVWGETTEMAVSVARSALPSWARRSV